MKGGAEIDDACTRTRYRVLPIAQAFLCLLPHTSAFLRNMVPTGKINRWKGRPVWAASITTLTGGTIDRETLKKDLLNKTGN